MQGIMKEAVFNLTIEVIRSCNAPLYIRDGLFPIDNTYRIGEN